MKTYSYVPLEKNDYGFVLVNEYSELLKRKEWKQKRKEILKKDNYHCTNCKQSSTFFVGGQHVKGIKLIGRKENGKPFFKPIKTNNPISLHIHHTFYVLEREPWYYNKKDLVTLCENCHKNEHERVSIPIYFTERDLQINNSPNIVACFRCGGDGYLPHFNYVQNGVCFQCKGLCFLKKVKIANMIKL